MKIIIPGLIFNKAVYNAAGTFEYGEYQWARFAKEKHFDDLPALTLKTSTMNSKITSKDRKGLIYYTKKDMINSVGLQSPNIEIVKKKILEYNKNIKKPLIASITGDDIDEISKMANIMSNLNIAAIEINLSCPNIKKGGLSLGTKEIMIEEIIRECKRVSKVPIYAKLTPNVTNISKMAIAAEKGGADAIVAINTCSGLIINPITGKSVLNNGYGGYSGPAIFPLALKAVHQIYKVVNIPIIGVGGITSGQDVIDMMSVGAKICQIASATRNELNVFKRINNEVIDILKNLKVNDINDIIGRSHKYNY